MVDNAADRKSIRRKEKAAKLAEANRHATITNLFDKQGEPTRDPALAASCVIMLSSGEWLPQNADDVPIYTVH